MTTHVSERRKLDKEGLAALFDPGRNAPGVVRAETFKFVRRCVGDYRAVEEVAQEHLGTEEVSARPGFDIHCYAFPPILALAHVALYNFEKVSSPLLAPQASPEDRLNEWLMRLPEPESGIYMLVHYRDFDDCPNEPRLVSARLELGSRLWEAREHHSWCRRFLHAARITFTWIEELHFVSDPALFDPLQGMKLVARYDQDLEARLEWQCRERKLAI